MLYLLFGDDAFSAREFRQKLIADAIPPDCRDFNLLVLDGQRATWEEIVSACEVLPFIAERRVVCLEGGFARFNRADKISDKETLPLRGKGSRKAKLAGTGERLVAYLTKMPATTTLIWQDNNEVNRNGILFRAFSKTGETREFNRPKGAELQQWIVQQVTREGARIEPAAALTLSAFVSERSGLDQVSGEISKLVTYVRPGGTITQPIVELLVADTHQQNAFELVDALGSRQAGKALRLLYELNDRGESTPIYLIARQMRQLLQVKELVAQRLGPDEIAKRVGMHPFVARKSVEQAQKFSLAELLNAHEKLLEIDVATKTGRGDPALLLDLLLVEFGASPKR